MNSNLKKQLESTEKELVKTKSDLKLVESKLEYCQERLLDIRNEKDELLKKVRSYEVKNIDMELKEAQLIKHDFLKQKHRLEITKELLDESRKEVVLLKEIVEDFKNTKNIDFIRNKYPKSFNLYNIKYNEYNRYDKYKINLNNMKIL